MLKLAKEGLVSIMDLAKFYGKRGGQMKLFLKKIADLFRGIEDRFTSIEDRLSRLERDRFGHQKEWISR